MKMNFKYEKYTATSEIEIYYLQQLEKTGDQLALMRKAEQSAFWRSVLFVKKNELPEIIHKLIKAYELQEQSYLDLVDNQNKKHQNYIKELEFKERLNEFLDADFETNLNNQLEVTQLQLL
jgi:hypothetical protein